MDERSHTSKPATNIRHKVHRETPLAIYIALQIFGAAKHCEKTLNQLHKFGICPLYARVRDISKKMANSVRGPPLDSQGGGAGVFLK